MQLTPRQADVILMIRNHRHLHGHSPSIREICGALGLARGTVMAHVERLIEKQLLRRVPCKHRTLEVVEDAQGVTPKPAKVDKLSQVQAKLDALRAAG